MPLTEQQVRQIAQQEIAKGNNSSRFQLSPTSRHIHNNVDAPFVYLPTLTYGGKVLSSGESSVPFPSSFRARQIATGLYFITTNMDESSYSVICSPAGNAIVPVNFVSHIIETVNDGTYGSGFYVCFFDTSTQVNTDTDFYFQLFQVANTGDAYTKYIT